MKILDYFRKLLKKEKQISTEESIIEEKETAVEYEDVYTHAFDRPIKDKFVGIHRESDAKYKKMKIKKQKSEEPGESEPGE